MITYLDILMPSLGFIIAYLLGSIPNAIIIGKIFFKQDITTIGSGNPGGTNASRAWGKKVGIIVILLDMFKAALPTWIAILVFNFTNLKNTMLPDSISWGIWLTGLGAVIGHCFSIYIKFKGGKGVATIAGFVGLTSIFQLILGLSTFLTTLKIKKMVSLSSIMLCVFGTLAAWILFIVHQCGFVEFVNNSFIFCPTLISMNLAYPICITIASAVIIYRHKDNIKRMINDKENKI